MFSPKVRWEGDIGGYRIPQYRKRKIGKYRNTVKYRHRFYDRSRFILKVESISRVCFSQACDTPEINLSHDREKTREDLELIGTAIEKLGHWMFYQFHLRVNVRNCLINYR